VEIKTFVAYHLAALETDEPRHNLILAIIARAASDSAPTLRVWSLGPPGACAVQNPGWPLVLGQVDEQQCYALAEQMRDTNFPGVVGPENTATWFVTSVREFGVIFAEHIPQQIHAIRDSPSYSGAAGGPRPVTSADARLFADWRIAFSREATPHDPTPNREQLEKEVGEEQYLFWAVKDEPVSMAGIVRRTRHGAAIAGVYTPPELRGRGYAGSVTAALVERAYVEGKSFVCLYTDLRNPYSNRCYTKVGFRPVCKSWHYPGARRDPPLSNRPS
jgi:RimJ/RimL family protein N-acetyltransferase